MSDSTITMYGTTWCGDCRRAKRVFEQHEVAINYVNIEENETARHYVEQVNNGYQSVPTIVFPDGSILVEPSTSALTQKLATLK